jgi:hypothetical protein
MEGFRAIWVVPEGEKLVSMITYHDVVMIATDRRLYLYGPEEEVNLLKLTDVGDSV